MSRDDRETRIHRWAVVATLGTGVLIGAATIVCLGALIRMSNPHAGEMIIGGAAYAALMGMGVSGIGVLAALVTSLRYDHDPDHADRIGSRRERPPR